ncbi:DUF421 domain-containing protein [Xylophilus sp. GOD-11R]|uniref:DUF421 domain-containing protein n=1 Tax=Xylophilus sp. GOD-11R TaxID=3089814 RepID=UPI00298D5664|nr:YetF domain-containing protein [Xylophilus sp. GOD-11R]WPB55845.1 DUF421 domain-containing protein [Xylophilus sp. GOD-11R]
MNLPALDLEGMLTFTLSPWELMLRGTVMFWFLLLIFRFVLRRDMGDVGVSDFLFVVILGDAAQNAMIGDGTSTLDGMVLIGTLVAWNFGLDWLGYRVPAVERFVSGSRICLVRHGRLQRRALRREYITEEDVMAKLREEGLERLDQVKLMNLETDGQISVVKVRDV